MVSASTANIAPLSGPVCKPPHPSTPSLAPFHTTPPSSASVLDLPCPVVLLVTAGTQKKALAFSPLCWLGVLSQSTLWHLCDSARWWSVHSTYKVGGQECLQNDSVFLFIASFLVEMNIYLKTCKLSYNSIMFYCV